jgi:hypothetical protein
MTFSGERIVSANLQLLLDIIDRAFNKGSWHGANLMGSLRGVSAKQASKRIRGRKNIWEQALHAAYWKHIVLNKLIGTQPFPRRGSNWIAQPRKATEDAWRADLRLLHDIHEKLRAAVIASRGRLSPKVLKMVYGAAFHDVYHAGQIKLLRRFIS